jgi:hypothetical protein
MDLSFDNAALATLCNSERRLIQRWGAETGRTVARRLLELAAADAATVDRLPGTSVTIDGGGDITIIFADSIVVRGVLTKSGYGPKRTQQSGEHIVITSLSVQGSDQ